MEQGTRESGIRAKKTKGVVRTGSLKERYWGGPGALQCQAQVSISPAAEDCSWQWAEEEDEAESQVREGSRIGTWCC